MVPDFVKAVVHHRELLLRYPEAVRPWQHVLALVHGYLILLAGLLSNDPQKYTKAWNLGPQESKQYSVRDVLESLAASWKRPALKFLDNPLPEAQSLSLDSSMARNQLNWLSTWDTKQVIQETAAWYRDYYEHPEAARDITIKQINAWREGIKE